jgi:hypothetical protein
VAIRCTSGTTGCADVVCQDWVPSCRDSDRRRTGLSTYTDATLPSNMNPAVSPAHDGHRRIRLTRLCRRKRSDTHHARAGGRVSRSNPDTDISLHQSPSQALQHLASLAYHHSPWIYFFVSYLEYILCSLRPVYTPPPHVNIFPVFVWATYYKKKDCNSVLLSRAGIYSVPFSIPFYAALRDFSSQPFIYYTWLAGATTVVPRLYEKLGGPV